MNCNKAYNSFCCWFPQFAKGLDVHTTVWTDIVQKVLVFHLNVSACSNLLHN
jgi:hypothetical protein